MLKFLYLHSSQHVIIFSNEPPDMSKWSEDRYDVNEIKPSLYQQVVAGADAKRTKIGTGVYTGNELEIGN